MRRLLMATALAAALFATTACEPTSTAQPGPGESGPPDEPPTIQLAGPADGATDVSTAAELAFTVAGTQNVAVTLTSAAGEKVEGAMRADNSSWVPAAQLAYQTTYTATITATKSTGPKAEAKTTFTTMAKPENLVDIHSFIGDDQVVGVAMPIVIQFGLDVPEPQRAEIQRRLFVTSTPAQEGAWNWFSSHEIHYRPREYWQPNTKLDVRIATGGLSWGVNTWYGRHDLTLTFSVGPKVTIDVDNKTKKLTVYQNDKAIKTMPVSLGKPSSPSSSGVLPIISRNTWEWFDSSTYGVPVNSPDGYRTKVEWTMRLTWSGEYIHAAPWSVADQGKRNVSHGCVNISTANAKWLYNLVKVGDPVTVRNTERKVKWTDGWTDWNLPWEDYIKGSAIPYAPQPTAPAPSGS